MARKRSLLLLVAALATAVFATWTTLAYAAAPPNDNIDSAIWLEGYHDTLAGTNVHATEEYAEPPACGCPMDTVQSVWYAFGAPAHGWMTIEVSSSEFDTVVGVWQGDAVLKLKWIAGNDDGVSAESSDSRVTFWADGPYRIVVAGKSDAAVHEGNFTISWFLQAPGATLSVESAPVAGSEVAPGAPIDLAITVTNIGGVPLVATAAVQDSGGLMKTLWFSAAVESGTDDNILDVGESWTWYDTEAMPDGDVTFTVFGDIFAGFEGHFPTSPEYVSVSFAELKSGTLNGTVVDLDSGAPLEGATIQVGAGYATTGPDGTYSFDLPVGSYTVVASKAGYGPESAAVIVTSGCTVTQDFALRSTPEEDIVDTIRALRTAVLAGTLAGTGPGSSAKGKLGAFQNMLASAEASITTGDYAGALDQLRAAYAKCDGNPLPPDLVTGTEREAIATKILALVAKLEAMVP